MYKVRQGQRIVDPTLTYLVGGDENATIAVDPVDFGLPPGATPSCISLAAIRYEMEDISVVFEVENEE